MKRMIDNKEDLLLTKALLEKAKEEGIDISDKNINLISEEGVKSEKADKVLNAITEVINVKNKLFSNVEIADLSDEEYENLLNEFDKSVSISVPHYELSNISSKYPNINFKNLDNRTPNFIITGDILYDTMTKTFGDEWDYGPVIMQWCRAVELELRNKIYSRINSRSAKEDIGNKSMESNYYINGSKQYRNFAKLKVSDMMGFYGAIKKFDMSSYIYNKYLKNYYSNLSLDVFNKLIDYICVVNDYRDNSAHSISQKMLNKTSADDCKNYILASKKILEILSQLKTY